MEEPLKNSEVSKPNTKLPISNGPIFLLIGVLLIIASAVLYLVWLQRGAILQSPRGFESLQQELVQQGESLRAQQAQISDLQRKWREEEQNSDLNQIAYLVKMANLNLLAGQDVNAAQQILKMAMQKAANLKDPIYADLKKSLEADFARLSSMSSFNPEAIILALEDINQRIQLLPTVPNVEFKANAEKKSEDTLPWYKRFLNSLAGLKDLFIIRHVGSHSPLLIRPQEEIFLKENIQTKIMQAEWAVLHQRPLIYERNLKDVENWLKQYFHDPKNIQPILISLSKLQAFNVRPNFSGLDNSLRIINELKQSTGKGLDSPFTLTGTPRGNDGAGSSNPSASTTNGGAGSTASGDLKTPGENAGSPSPKPQKAVPAPSVPKIPPSNSGVEV